MPEGGDGDRDGGGDKRGDGGKNEIMERDGDVDEGSQKFEVHHTARIEAGPAGFGYYALSQKLLD